MLKMIVFGGQSTNDSSLYSQSLRNKVERKGGTLSKTCKGVKTSLCRTQRNTYRTRQNPGQFWNPCRTNFLGLEKRTCPGKRGRLVTLDNERSCCPPSNSSDAHTLVQVICSRITDL